MDTTMHENKALQVQHRHVTPEEELDALLARIGIAEARGEGKAAAEMRKELQGRLRTFSADSAEARIREVRQQHAELHLATEDAIGQLAVDLEECREAWEGLGPRIRHAFAELEALWREHEEVWHRHEPLRKRAMELRNRVRHHGLDLEVPVPVDFTEAMGIPDPYLGAHSTLARLEEKYRGKRPAPLVLTGNGVGRRAKWPEKEEAVGPSLGAAAKAAMARFVAGG